MADQVLSEQPVKFKGYCCSLMYHRGIVQGCLGNMILESANVKPRCEVGSHRG